MNTKHITFSIVGLLLVLAQLACLGGAAAPTAAPTKPTAVTTAPEPTALPQPVIKLGEEYRVDEGGFAFHLVPDYTVTALAGIAQMGPEGYDSDVGPCITFVGGPNDLGLSLENGFDAFSGDFDSATADHTENTTVSGYSARITDFTAVSAGKEMQGRFVVAVSPDNAHTFAMVAVAPPAQWKELAPYFEAVLESVDLYAPTAAVFNLETIRQWATSAVASSEFGSTSWTAIQATGQPDTLACGDFGTAWASASSTGADWIEVYYDTPVIPTEINIYESYNPSSVTSVQLIDVDGIVHPLYTGVPSKINDPCPYVFSLPVTFDSEIYAVRIEMDQSVLGGWNEIDAVELVGEAATSAGTTTTTTSDGALEQFATSAIASSQYGEQGWAARQALGEPNVGDSCGDSISAWASAGTGEEWLEVYFDTPVTGSELQVYQNYNPNQIVLIEAIDEDGQYHEIFAGAPGGITECPDVLVVPIFEASYKVAGVRITVDQSVVNSWNEIDAVKLIGTP